MRALISSWLVAVIVAAAGCSESGPGAPSSTAQTVATTSSTTRVYDGKWNGVTDAGYPVIFTITEDHVRSFFIELPEIPGNSCVFGREGFSIDGSHNFDLAGKGDPAVAEGRFTIVSVAPMYAGFDHASSIMGSTNFTLTGTLEGTTGEGTGEFVFSAGGCSAQSSVRWNIRLVASQP